VNAHEHAHVVRRDPLRRSLLSFLACTLFWIPALRQRSEDMEDEGGIQADDAAARPDALALASALSTPDGAAAPAAGLSSDRRLDYVLSSIKELSTPPHAVAPRTARPDREDNGCLHARRRPASDAGAVVGGPSTGTRTGHRTTKRCVGVHQPPSGSPAVGFRGRAGFPVGDTTLTHCASPLPPK